MRAWQKITALTMALVAKGEAPTREQAIARVGVDRPDLSRRYQSAPQVLLEAMAKLYVEDGKVPTLEQGFALACDERPDLLHQALREECVPYTAQETVRTATAE